MSNAIAIVAQVSNALNGGTKITKKAQRQITDYVNRGREITQTEEFYLAPFTEKAKNTLTVREVVYQFMPEGSRNEKFLLALRINRLLRDTAYGRSLTTEGHVAMAPLGRRPTWFGHIASATSTAIANALVPTRTAASQSPRIQFPKSVSPALKEPVRTSLQNWCKLGGIGTRWRSPEAVATAHADVKLALRQVVRENALMLQITDAAKPMILNLVSDAVRQVAAGTAAASTEVAH